MDNFNFYSPTVFVFGKDRENKAGSYDRNDAAEIYRIAAHASLQR